MTYRQSAERSKSFPTQKRPTAFQWISRSGTASSGRPIPEQEPCRGSISRLETPLQSIVSRNHSAAWLDGKMDSFFWTTSNIKSCDVRLTRYPVTCSSLRRFLFLSTLCALRSVLTKRSSRFHHCGHDDSRCWVEQVRILRFSRLWIFRSHLDF